mmetsp:Transcript_3446/g.5001  ORF Transcript_3446/g.5001 Transcript_3446/m.5001 type:complete len:463 (-) Transcript_3446:109-1497(-)
MNMMESAEDAALNEALSMLDSLTPDDGFAIDSDDDDDDMNFNLDDELNQLEGIDLTNGGYKDEPTAGSDGLQSVNVAGGAGNDDHNKLDPPPHWATKQDVANMTTAPTSSSNAAAVSVTVNTSTLKEKSMIASNHNTATEAPLFHPLQDIGRPSSSTTAAATTPTTNINSSDSDNRSSSWTSSFASFAKVATASIQSAVESAEATLIHQGEPIAAGNVGSASASVGSGHQMNQNHQQGLLTTKSGAAGGAMVSTMASAPMSYQERQRLLHQKYHAANNSNNTATTTTNSNAAMMPASATVKGGAMPTQQQQQSPTKSSTQSINLKKPSTHHHTLPSRTIPPSSRSSPTSYNTTTNNTTTTSSSSTSPPQATSTPPKSSSSSSTTMTFLDKLTQNLDATTKNTLIAQAIGPLLPGERIIMFINNLKDVRDSRFGHLFVGSLEGVTTSFGLRDCLTGVVGGGRA